MPSSERKKTGSTFTPKGLATFLAERLMQHLGKDSRNSITILDPACGNGSLLKAIKDIDNDGIYNLLGYDTNHSYLEEAKELLGHSNNVKLQCKDFLSVCPNNIDLFSTDTMCEFADLVIANPPYVRTQVLGAERAQRLAFDFNLTGRVDLYYPFLMAMTNALKKGGLLGVITSNRYLSTKSGESIRKFLLDNFDIIEIIDLGDTKLFDAAVLPAIFIGRKKERKSSILGVAIYSSIYELEDKNIEASDCLSIYEILNKGQAGHYTVNNSTYVYKNGLLKHPIDKKGVWQMSTEMENDWIETINKNTAFRVKDYFRVRVGIKSCADDIFIRQKWEEEGFDIENDLLRPMISQENITAWHIDKDSMISVLYPHYWNNGRNVFDISDYPTAFAYLNKHRGQLEKRKYLIEAGRKWYEYWVPQNPKLWAYPKVVFPDISVRPRFCYDESGAIVNGNCYWICANNEEEKELLLLIEGVANSDVMIHYHDLCFNNKLYSGRRRFLTQYIEQYPMPTPSSRYAQEIIRLVKQIHSTTDELKRTELSAAINEKVKCAFCIMD